MEALTYMAGAYAESTNWSNPQYYYLSKETKIVTRERPHGKYWCFFDQFALKRFCELNNIDYSI